MLARSLLHELIINSPILIDLKLLFDNRIESGSVLPLLLHPLKIIYRRCFVIYLLQLRLGHLRYSRQKG
jgi:hypothetical protein